MPLEMDRGLASITAPGPRYVLGWFVVCVCVCMFVGSLQGPRAHACHDDDDDVCT